MDEPLIIDGRRVRPFTAGCDTLYLEPAPNLFNGVNLSELGIRIDQEVFRIKQEQEEARNWC